MPDSQVQLSDIDVAWAIHRLACSLLRYRHPVPYSRLSPSGVYLMFEDGEETPVGPRVVRIGISRAGGLAKRLRKHYADHRGSSVFRRHVGLALLARDGATQTEIARWRDRLQPMPAREAEVTEYIETHFSLCCIAVDDYAERCGLETWLVGSLSAWPVSPASPGWLGHYRGGKIANSGLWNVHGVLAAGSPVDGGPLTRLYHLARTLSGPDMLQGPRPGSA